MRRLILSAAALCLVLSGAGCEPYPDTRGTGTSMSGTEGMDGDMEGSDAEGGIDSGSSGAVRGPGAID